MNHLSTESIAIHAGRHGLTGHAAPLDLSTTFRIDDLAGAVTGIDAMAEGRACEGNPVYSRLHHPTVARFEEAIAALERTEAAVGFGSGMGAITAVLMAAGMRGKHVVAVRPLYGGTDHLLESRLLGLDVTWATADTVAEAIRSDTSLVLAETPANPTLDLVDIRAVVEAAGDVPVMVDSTFASPILQSPATLGARFVVHSATKLIGGHGDAMGGVVACSQADAAALRQMRILTGAVMHPMSGWMLHRGLQTLAARVEWAQRSAIVLAGRLREHAVVERVLYPGYDHAALVGEGRQMRGPGSMLSFVLPSAEAAEAVMKRVQLITPAVSLGSTDSLIQRPAALTHRVVSEEGRRAGGVVPGLLRMSVGLENADDLWRDLEIALG